MVISPASADERGVDCNGCSRKDYIYQGTWKTTNRKLDGTMTCVITPLAKEKWRGRF